MEIQFFCPRWGSENLGWKEFITKVKDAGYDGIEYAIARDVSERQLDEVWNEAAKQDIKIIAQHYDTYEVDFSKHFDLYTAWLEKIKLYPVIKVNSQTGKDFFSFEQNKQLIDAATATGLNVVHETHRNKFSFAAHITKDYLERIPGLQLTLDTSHWVCVAESYLEDQLSAMALATRRTEHIHARVGYPEGPQVPDPRVTEWQHALEKHLSWWDKVAKRKKMESKMLTVTPEFGPHPYMVHVPSSGEPIADQWEVNVYMMKLLKNRYDGRSNEFKYTV